MAHVHVSSCALRPNNTRLRREQPTSYSIYLLQFGVLFYPISDFLFLYKHLPELSLKYSVRIWPLQIRILILIQSYIKQP